MAAACKATTAPRAPTTTGGECVLAARTRAYELAARRTALTKEWADLLERRAQRVPAERERAAAKWLDWTRALAVEERAKLEVQRLVEAGERRAAEAGGVAYLCALPDDLRRVIIGRLRTALEPRWVVHFSSANKELRALLPLEDRRQLWAEHDEAIILGLKLGTGGSCQALRAKGYICVLRDRLSAADLATLAALGPELPKLHELSLGELSYSAGRDGAARLAKGLEAGALRGLAILNVWSVRLEAGARAIADALDRGALPRLENLALLNANIGDAALAALAPALRRRPALRALSLGHNPFGDAGLSALAAPNPPRGHASPPPAGGLEKLEILHIERTRITDAGRAALVAALDGGALPALQYLKLEDFGRSAQRSNWVYDYEGGSRWGWVRGRLAL